MTRLSHVRSMTYEAALLTGGFGISDAGISGLDAGRHSNRRDEVHEEAET
jgi:hypothetical protein